MKQWLKWLCMLSKRLYKRAAFLAILALIPLAVLALEVAARADSGFLHVVLTETDPDDPISSQLVERFMEEPSLVMFTYVDSPREALAMVEQGEADAAWVFPADMEQKMTRFVTSHYTRGGVVMVVERKQTVISRVAREKLNFALQHYSAPICYLNYARNNVPQLDDLTDQELMTYFNEVEFNEELFQFRTPDGGATVQTDTNYLLAPVRGLLGVLMVLCGLAAALFYLQDEERGTFALVPLQRRGAVAFACLLIAVMNVSVVVLLALWFGGVATFILKELLILLLYAVCCAAFCLLMLRLCHSIRVLAAVLPVLVTGMFVLCPIFFDIYVAPWLKFALPPTYLVYSAHNDAYLLYMLLYAVVCVVMAYGVKWVAGRIRRLGI